MRAKVLIVDDQPDIRKLVRMTLDIGDFDLCEADSGESSLEMISRENPQIVLMDIMMPGKIDGLEACRRIRADPRLDSTVVIMLSARGQEVDIEAGRAAGAVAYLVKPFSPLQLLESVTEISRISGASPDMGNQSERINGEAAGWKRY